MLVWIQGSLCHIAAGSHPVQKAWSQNARLVNTFQIKNSLLCV